MGEGENGFLIIRRRRRVLRMALCCTVGIFKLIGDRKTEVWIFKYQNTVQYMRPSKGGIQEKRLAFSKWFVS